MATIRKFLHADYAGMFRAEGGAFKYPFLTPGSAQYPDILWDWDSWLSNVALRQVLAEKATGDEKAKALKHEQGCVLNYLNYGGFDGWVPIIVKRDSPARGVLMAIEDTYATNMHKPCLAQHAAFLTKLNGGDAEWLREAMFNLQSFVNRYKNHQRHAATGLYFWNDDMAIGVDNDPRKIGRRVANLIVRSSADLKQVVKESGAEIGVLAVPAESAQENYEALADAGVKGVLNFAPVRVKRREDVPLKNVDLRINLEELAFFLR